MVTPTPDLARLEACLPADLRGPTTTITPITAGLSGAGVYRVEKGEQAFVLKISAVEEPLFRFWSRLQVQRLAAAAGFAPRVVHEDETRRAIVSAFVVDRSFPAFYADPRTRDAALAQLARTLRGLHALPLPPDADARDPRRSLADTWSGLSGFALPLFVGDAVRRVLAEEAPEGARARVSSHNDVNPSNLVYDGTRLLLLDWDSAGSNDPFYDLAVISVFLRMDERACLTLLGAYDGEPIATVPARWVYYRRLVAVQCGTMFLHLARRGGHVGATGDETVDETPTLAEVYARMRSGALSPATGEGQWWFGLALVKESVSLR